jgi:hypothetical protein
MFAWNAIGVDFQNRFDLLFDSSAMSKSDGVGKWLDCLERQGSYSRLVENNLFGIFEELALDDYFDLGSALSNAWPYPFDISKHVAGNRCWTSNRKDR